MSRPPEPSYLVAGCRPWSRLVFDENLSSLPGRWHFVPNREALTVEAVQSIDPRYLFFLHWSWLVPDEVVDGWECVCFHMTDLPYGRGGSPLQNLIVRGHLQTRLTAFRMTAEIDAGPIYLKEDLSLAGSAQEIYTRSSGLAARMIQRILLENPTPYPQEGDVIEFRRRTPDESAIPPLPSGAALYDFVRMLDAEGYPRAYIELAGFRYEFSNAKLSGEQLRTDVHITATEEIDR